MPVVGLDAYRKKEESDDEDKKGNSYYAGGVGSQGGGSGLSIEAGPDRTKRVKTVKLYKNGYIIDGEEFVKKDDTEDHKRVYETLSEGYVPRELEEMVRKHNVQLGLEDMRTQTYLPPPPRFGYTSHKVVQEKTTSVDSKATKYSDKSQYYTQGKKVASVRIHLLTGKNYTQAITEEWDMEDLYFVASKQTPGQSFELLGGFPPKPLLASQEKLMSSGISGTVVRQVAK